MNNQDWKTDIRKERHSITQEDFTPDEVLDVMFKDIDKSLFYDFQKTFCDPCIGIGNIYIYILKRRLKYCSTADDIYNAISSMYGMELMEDNVEECRSRIFEVIKKFKSNIDENKIKLILRDNIVCCDTLNIE